MTEIPQWMGHCEFQTVSAFQSVPSLLFTLVWKVRSVNADFKAVLQTFFCVCVGISSGARDPAFNLVLGIINCWLLFLAF